MANTTVPLYPYARNSAGQPPASALRTTASPSSPRNTADGLRRGPPASLGLKTKQARARRKRSRRSLGGCCGRPASHPKTTLSPPRWIRVTGRGVLVSVEFCEETEVQRVQGQARGRCCEADADCLRRWLLSKVAKVGILFFQRKKRGRGN